LTIAPKFLLAGTDVVGTTSALLRNGPEHMKVLVEARGASAFGKCIRVREQHRQEIVAR